MNIRLNRGSFADRLVLSAVAVSLIAGTALEAWAEGGQDKGRRRGSALSRTARKDLERTGITRYLGQFEPASETDIDGWTRYTFDSDGGNGPICIDGSEFRVFIQKRDVKNVVVFLPGGGACWQGLYACSTTAPMNPPGASGIFADSFPDEYGDPIFNPLKTYSKVVLSYCDGSIYGGDNDVPDMTFPAGPVRYHRGVRNMSAALDLAQATFPNAQRILLTGASAGGYGVNGVSAMLVRFKFPKARLRVFNDSGPLNNPAFVSGINAQVADWDFVQYYPESCTGCDPFAQPSEVIKYWLDNDRRMKASLFSYDGDGVIRFFIQVPTEDMYRDLLLTTTDPIAADYGRRYNRFVAVGAAHTILGSNAYYTLEVDGVRFVDWLDSFANGGRDFKDVVEARP